MVRLKFPHIAVITIPAAVLAEQFFPHAADFIKNRIRHDQFFLRIACPKRTCGIDSGVIEHTLQLQRGGHTLQKQIALVDRPRHHVKLVIAERQRGDVSRLCVDRKCSAGV